MSDPISRQQEAYALMQHIEQTFANSPQVLDALRLNQDALLCELGTMSSGTLPAVAIDILSSQSWFRSAIEASNAIDYVPPETLEIPFAPPPPGDVSGHASYRVDEFYLAAVAANLEGKAHMEGGRDADAQQAFLRSLAWLRKLRREPDQAVVLRNLGLLHTCQGDPANRDQARSYFHQSSMLAQSHGDAETHAWNTFELGSLAEADGDPAAAASFYQAALAQLRAIPSPSLLSIQMTQQTLVCLGVLSNNRQDSDTARTYLEEAYQMAKTNGFTLGEVIACIGLGLAFARQGHTGASYQFLVYARSLAERTGSMPHVHEADHVLGLLRQSIGEQKWSAIVESGGY